MPSIKIHGKVEGADQLVRNLTSLGSTKARAVNRRAITSASSDPLKAAKKNAPVETGLLKKSLGKNVRTYRHSGVTYVAIGPRPGFRDPVTGRNPINYAHLVELGTATANAKPFMRPALLQTQSDVTRTYGQRAWAGIRREVEKMKK